MHVIFQATGSLDAGGGLSPDIVGESPSHEEQKASPAIYEQQGPGTNFRHQIPLKVWNCLLNTRQNGVSIASVGRLIHVLVP